MNHKIKLLGLLVVLVLFASLAAGCGTPATEAPEPEAPEAEAPEPEVEEPEMEEVEIDMFHFFSEGEAIQPMMVEWGEEFEAENPGYTVNWTWAGQEGAVQLLSARINDDDAPDASFTSDVLLAGFAREGVATPVDSYLDEMDYEGSTRWGDTFYEGVLSNGYNEDGAAGAHFYGIPTGLHFSGIFFNQAQFEENGYEIPETFDELIALCDEIQANDGMPCFSGDNYANYNARPLRYIWRRLVGNQVMYDTALNVEGTSWVDTPEFLEGAKLGQKLFMDYYVPGWQGNEWPTGQADFANLGEAMIFMPTWLPSELLDIKADEMVLDVFPVPNIDGGWEGAPEYEMKFNGWFIPEGAENPEAAIQFIKFLTTKKAMEEQMLEGEIASPVIGVALPTVLESFLPQLEEGVGVRFGGGLDADAVEWEEAVFHPLVFDLLVGNLTPEEFIQQLQEAHDDFYDN